MANAAKNKSTIVVLRLTFAAVAWVTNGFSHYHRMINTSNCTDAKVTEYVVKDLLL